MGVTGGKLEYVASAYEPPLVAKLPERWKAKGFRCVLRCMA